jgi:hypothetical protein
MDKMSCVGVLAPCVQLRLQSLVERRQWLGFHVVGFMVYLRP